jgi:hypothetical protein
VNLADLVTAYIDQIQQQFDQLSRHVDRWQYTLLSDTDARLAIYWAFKEGKIKKTIEKNFCAKTLALYLEAVSSLTSVFTRPPCGLGFDGRAGQTMTEKVVGLDKCHPIVLHDIHLCLNI